MRRPEYAAATGAAVSARRRRLRRGLRSATRRRRAPVAAGACLESRRALHRPLSELHSVRGHRQPHRPVPARLPGDERRVRRARDARHRAQAGTRRDEGHHRRRRPRPAPGHRDRRDPEVHGAVGGRPILHWQLDALAAAGVDDVVIVRGYLGDRIAAPPGGACASSTTREWAENNILTSLFYARDRDARAGFLFSYSDIVFAHAHARAVGRGGRRRSRSSSTAAGGTPTRAARCTRSARPSWRASRGAAPAPWSRAWASGGRAPRTPPASSSGLARFSAAGAARAARACGREALARRAGHARSARAATLRARLPDRRPQRDGRRAACTLRPVLHRRQLARDRHRAGSGARRARRSAPGAGDVPGSDPDALAAPPRRRRVAGRRRHRARSRARRRSPAGRPRPASPTRGAPPAWPGTPCWSWRPAGRALRPQLHGARRGAGAGRRRRAHPRRRPRRRAPAARHAAPRRPTLVTIGKPDLRAARRRARDRRLRRGATRPGG